MLRSLEGFARTDGRNALFYRVVSPLKPPCGKRLRFRTARNHPEANPYLAAASSLAAISAGSVSRTQSRQGVSEHEAADRGPDAAPKWLGVAGAIERTA